VEAHWQPQVRGVQPQLADEADELEEEFVPLEGATKTESWMVCFALEHFGHVIAWVWLMTMRS
jgi:hypothetical protein